ncbi:MAG: stage II sporulation protein M [Candidatus Nanoarchaeia archaeon]|nr:stage II sporulation protein M [Candidatus Nanoarchaeia archaeon]
MVIESIINSFNAEKRPYFLILIGFLYSLIAAALSMWIFPDQASLIMVFLIVMASIPLMISVIKDEEKKDVSEFHEIILLKEHGKALLAFMCLFIGVTLGMALLYTILPGETTSTMFDAQIKTISGMSHAVSSDVTGKFIAGFDRFSNIFLNNVKVLMFCLLFSFLYGAGAIFILTWNASVIGTAIGNFIRGELALLSGLVGLDKFVQYFNVISIGLMKYAIHGIPEILAYFTAGLAGGIISIAVIKHDFGGKKFEHIVLDSADLILLSIAILFIAGILEIWVTPIFF